MKRKENSELMLRNITIKRLLKLPQTEFEKYQSVLKFLKPKPFIKKNKAIPIEDLTFGQVLMIRNNLQNPTSKKISYIFATVFKMSERKLLRVKVVDFFHGLNWLQEQMKTLYEKEKVLNVSTDPKLERAGIKDLNKFGELNTLISIAERFSIAPQVVETWSYSLVFALIYHSKVSNEINKRYSEILSKK